MKQSVTCSQLQARQSQSAATCPAAVASQEATSTPSPRNKLSHRREDCESISTLPTLEALPAALHQRIFFLLATHHKQVQQGQLSGQSDSISNPALNTCDDVKHLALSCKTLYKSYCSSKLYGQALGFSR